VSFTIGAMSDETEPAITTDMPTAVHAPAPAPAEPLAYSETVELPEPRRSHLPVGLFITAALALTGASAGWFLLRPTAPATHNYGGATSSSAPSTPTIPAVADPTPAPAIVDGPAIDTEQAPAPPTLHVVVIPPPPDPDTIYISQITQIGVPFTNREGAITAGHYLCSLLSQGYTYDRLLSEAMTGGSPPLTRPETVGLIHAAVGAYCPQYNSRIG
jgi:hypothetical protein